MKIRRKTRPLFSGATRCLFWGREYREFSPGEILGKLLFKNSLAEKIHWLTNCSIANLTIYISKLSVQKEVASIAGILGKLFDESKSSVCPLSTSCDQTLRHFLKHQNLSVFGLEGMSSWSQNRTIPMTHFAREKTLDGFEKIQLSKSHLQ